jgi:DNA (cytosine-5)-methyltransferase 1
MKHFGDITKIDGHKVPKVDIITGGSPCQDLSVAGRREGLAGERSGLFMDQIRIVKEMRDECRKSNEVIRPRFLVWENVVGAFSSGNPGGADFQAVLEEIVRIVRKDCPSIPIPEEGWAYAGNLDGVGDDGTPFSICWRTHDAQYWGRTIRDGNTGDVLALGTPQRRRRIALVADFGGTSAPEILFECQGLSWNPQQSGETRKGTSGDSENGSGETSKRATEGVVAAEDPANAKVYGISGFDSNAMKSDNPHSGIYEADTTRTLDLNGGNPACNQGGMMVVQDVGTPTGDCLNSWDVQSKHIQPENGIAESLYAGESRYGGGESYVMQTTAYGVTTKGNGDAFINPNTHTSLSVGGGEAGQGYPCVLQQEPVLLESNQNHATIQTDGVSTTLPASMGEGGGYVPMVVQDEPICVGNGQLAQARLSDKVGTLNCMHDQQAVLVFNPEPKSTVCVEGNGSRESHKGDGYIESDTMYTLNTVEQHAVAYPVQTIETFHLTTESDLASTLKARDYKDPQVVAFEPGAASRVGGHVYEDGKAGTLRAEMGDNQQAIVQSAGFCTEHSADAHSIGYQSEISPTLREGVVPATIYGCVGFDAFNQASTGDVSMTVTGVATDPHHIPCVVAGQAVESHAQDARYNVGDINQPLSANMEHDPANGGLVMETMSIGNGQVHDAMSPSVEVSKTLNCLEDPAKILCRTAPNPSVVYSVDEGGGKSSCCHYENVSPTLATTHHGEPAVCYGIDQQGGKGAANYTEGVAPTMAADSHGTPHAVAYRKSSHAKTSDDGQGWEETHVNDTLNIFDNGEARTPTVILENEKSKVFENHSQDTRFNELGDVCQTVSATWGMGGNNQPLEVNPQSAIVRRLTPLECERLQGFPDFWTDLGEWTDTQGKKHKDADSPRYKALGNSICLPFWNWMSGRMVAELRKSGVENPTMASLFDGISGFPLVYLVHGCTPKWTSEIEEFPIAVCKRHFGDEDTGEVGDVEKYLYKFGKKFQ